MMPSIQSGAQGQRLAFLALASSADDFDAERTYHKMAAGCLDQVWVMLMRQLVTGVLWTCFLSMCTRCLRALRLSPILAVSGATV